MTRPKIKQIFTRTLWQWKNKDFESVLGKMIKEEMLQTRF